MLEYKQILCNIRCTYTLSSYKVVTSKIIKQNFALIQDVNFAFSGQGTIWINVAKKIAKINLVSRKYKSKVNYSVHPIKLSTSLCRPCICLMRNSQSCHLHKIFMITKHARNFVSRISCYLLIHFCLVEWENHQNLPEGENRIQQEFQLTYKLHLTA